MKLSLGSLGSVALALLGIASAAVACSSSDAPHAEAAPQLDVEGGAIPPSSDASVVAVVDGGADVDAEAEAPRVCSDEGFCHTALPKNQTLRGVWGDGLGIVWAVSEQGAILRYDGKTWSVIASSKGALYAIWGSGPTDIWVGGEGGLQHGQGASSSSVAFASVKAPGDPRAPITSIWGMGANDVWAAGSLFDAGYVGRILHYAAGEAGPSWTEDGVSGQPISYSRVWGSPASGVWLAGLRSHPVTFASEVVVLRRNAGAGKFSEVPVPGDPQAPKGIGQIDTLYDARATADGTMWILGRTNTSKPGYARGTTTDGGLTFAWTFVPHGYAVGPLSAFVSGASASDAWIGGEYGRLRHWDGAAWTQAKTTITKLPETTPLHAMWSQGQDLWVVGDGIAMHRDPSKKN